MSHCTICGERSEEVWRGKCESCSELEKLFEILVHTDKKFALQWLYKQQQELEGSSH